MKMKKTIDYNSLDIDGIDYSDYPDFCDSYICYGEYTDGTELSDEDYDKLNDDSELVYELTMKRIY